MRARLGLPMFVLSGYDSFLGFLLISAAVPVLALVANKLLAPKSRQGERQLTYESGMEPIGGDAGGTHGAAAGLAQIAQGIDGKGAGRRCEGHGGEVLSSTRGRPCARRTPGPAPGWR